MAPGRSTINIVITDDDRAWLKDYAENGPYHFPSTAARYLLAEIIEQKRSASVETKSNKPSTGTKD